MFKKGNIDALFGELNTVYKEDPDSEQLHRDAHLAIALFDSGRPLSETIDPRVVNLVEKHKPSE